jgi:hypothetical protein
MIDGLKRQPNEQELLEVWLNRQGPQVAAAIAARAALRVAPLVVRAARIARNAKDVSGFLALTSAIFRASALARVATKHPSRANEIGAAALVAAARAAAAEAAASVRDSRAVGATAAALAAAAAAADAAADATALDAPFAAPLAGPAPFAAPLAAADAAVRREIRFDASALRGLGSRGLTDLPLWSQVGPDWATSGWEDLTTVLPKDEGWDVWIEWYEARLGGGSGGEAYELAFAIVPSEVWDRGAAAAHQWIRQHLPRGPSGSRPSDFPIQLLGPI